MKNQTEFQNLLEQLRSEENGNNAAKENVVEKTMEEMNTRSTTPGNERFVATLNSSVATMTTYSYTYTPHQANVMGTGGAMIGYGNPIPNTDPRYYFSEFCMTLQSVQNVWGLTEQKLKTGIFQIALEGNTQGYCEFVIINTQGDEVLTWDSRKLRTIQIALKDLYDEERERVYFKLMTTNQSTDFVAFPISNMVFIEGRMTSLAIKTPPNKTEYLVGESFDPRGMVVEATYCYGSTEVVTDYTMAFNGFDTADVTESQEVNISVSWNGFTANESLTISIDEVKYVAAPYVRGSNTQMMDIHIPANLGENERVPAVITIHGGNWRTGDKGYYDYMTDFITHAPTVPEDYDGPEGEYLLECNCVHVSINYRLMGNGGGLDTNPEAPVPYQQMLEDISSAIGYLQSHADIYHINPEKIALMGHSAGGHLALLYAYKAAKCQNCDYKNSCDNPNTTVPINCDRHKVSPAMPIELVISEAGPTNFVNSNNNIIVNNSDIFSVTGLTWNSNGEYSEEAKGLLKQASPYWIVKWASDKSIFPYTILAYGDGLGAQGNIYGDEDGNGLLDDGDGVILYSQASLLEGILNPTSSQVGGGTGDNASQIIEGENCTLFKFFGVDHWDFGQEQRVHPNVAIEENDAAEERALKTVIQNYYNTISSTLQELVEQED